MSPQEGKKRLAEQPVFVTSVAKREGFYPGGVTYEFPFGKDILEWLETLGVKPNITFASGSMKERDPLVHKIWTAMKAKDEAQLKAALEEAKPFLGKSSDERTAQEKWAFMVVQMPGDWGFHTGENRRRAEELITGMAKGRVLEAMCGFNSYINDAPQIRQVTALDFCREALERHSHPKRKRILFDMERVCKGEQIPFFKDGSFDTVSTSFGMDYMSDVARVYAEFYRILVPGGQVLVVGGTTQGYPDLIRQYFKPERHLALMTNAGFNAEVIPMPFKTQWEIGDYYMVAGKKPI